MVKEKVAITNPTGLHLRPTGKFCKKAAEYTKCRISFEYGSYTANAKSVLSVLAAGVKCGDEITLICEGEDEEAALAELVRYIRSGLGE